MTILSARPDVAAERDGAAAMRAESARILASPLLANSPVMARLLAFLVEETLAGRGHALKAYTVAVEGLGRPSSFDPETDSYPRVQVGRLRKLLAAHYALHPGPGPFLNIPLGAYRVLLSDRPPGTPVPAEPPASPEPGLPPAAIDQPRPVRSLGWTMGAGIGMAVLLALVVILLWRDEAGPDRSRAAMLSPVVLIQTARPEAGGAGARSLADAAAANLADGLRRSWVLRPLVAGPLAETLASDARYTIETQAGPAAGRGFHLYVRFIDRASGSVLWSTDRTIASDPVAMKADLAPLIAKIASPFGIVAEAERARLGDSAAPGYPCLLRYGSYYRTRADDLRPVVARCLREPPPEPQLMPAILSARAIMLYATADDPARRPAALAEARTLADRAVALRSNSADALFANASLAFYLGRCGRGVFFARRALAANPYNPNMFGALGSLAFPCDQALSQQLLERARVLEPDGPPNFRVPLLVMAMAGNTSIDVDAVLTELETTAQAGPAYKALGRALAAAANGSPQLARAQWLKMKRLAKAEAQSDDEALRRYILSDPLRAIALEQLRAGGALAAG